VELLAYALAQAPGKEILMIETKISVSFYGHIRQYHNIQEENKAYLAGRKVFPSTPANAKEYLQEQKLAGVSS
jgi:hypothetical protein